jgi:ABC-type polysaccharide/polyol phosphate transport system ATPase subunit
MKRVGVTGGIGSGKSTVCRILKVLRVPAFHADDEAKALLNADPAVRHAVAGSGSVRVSTLPRDWIGRRWPTWCSTIPPSWPG